MSKPQRLMRRGSRLYIRVRVPDRLRPQIGRGEIWKSLGTSDYALGLQRLRQASAEIDLLFRETGSELPNQPASREAVSEMVRAWFAKQEHAAVDGFEPPNTQEEFEDRFAGTTEDEGNFLQRHEEDAGMQRSASELLAQHRLEAKVGSVEWWHAVRLVQRALVELVRRERARLTGEIDERHFDDFFAGLNSTNPAPKPQAKAGLTLRDLVDRYTNDPARHRSAKTLLSYGPIFRVLLELLGADTPIDRIDRDHIRNARDVLRLVPPNYTKRFPGMPLTKVADLARERGLKPISNTTLHSYLLNAAALFNYAVQEGYLQSSPASLKGLALPKIRKQGRRLPFSTEELQLIFARYAVEELRGGRFWVPLISLFGGLRLNEACQLSLEDIVTREGVLIILVRPDMEPGGQKRLKTQSSERAVPVHNELLRIGFGEYVDEQKTRSGVRLFPDLPIGKTGYFSDPFQKSFRRFLSRCGVHNQKVSFHSFRHNFRDALREARVPSEIIRNLGGWARFTSTDEIYGAGFTAGTLAAEVNKVTYGSGLDLSHLYRL